jgi:hypothetical protein
MLKKETTLFERDEKGELIAQTVPLHLSDRDAKQNPELVGETIKVIPVVRGKLKKIFDVDANDKGQQPDTNKDQDIDIILEHCIEPKYTAEELSFAKPVIIRSIVRTIFIESGVKLDDESGERKIDKDQDEFGKNS